MKIQAGLTYNTWRAYDEMMIHWLGFAIPILNKALSFALISDKGPCSLCPEESVPLEEQWVKSGLCLTNRRSLGKTCLEFKSNFIKADSIEETVYKGDSKQQWRLDYISKADTKLWRKITHSKHVISERLCQHLLSDNSLTLVNRCMEGSLICHHCACRCPSTEQC